MTWCASTQVSADSICVQAGYNLAEVLMLHDQRNMTAGISMLMDLHYIRDMLPVNGFNLLPPHSSRHGQHSWRICSHSFHIITASYCCLVPRQQRPFSSHACIPELTLGQRHTQPTSAMLKKAANSNMNFNLLLSPSDLVAQPLYLCRNAEGFVGLCNGSATCYMNAVFQQLFMQPAVRDLILSAPEAPQPARRESVFYQLQVRDC